MIKNLIKVAFRNIRKEKFFAALNILGLAIGTCCVILIGLYISDEVNYDKFHEKASKIYRINQTFIWGEDDNLFGSTGPAVAEAVRNEIPEFEAVTRVQALSGITMFNENKKPYAIFTEEGALAVDPDFMEVFTFPMLRGDKGTALDEPYSVLLTEKAKAKYFGENEAMNELLWIGESDKKKPYKVTGILKDVPQNSHIDFDVLLSMDSNPEVKDREWSWIWTTFVTFGVLKENVDVSEINLAARLEEVPRKHAGASLQKLQGVSFEEWEAGGKEWKLYAQPLLDIHLRSSNVYSRLNTVSDIKMMYVIGTVGILILFMCLINFVNLTTARSFGRAKEVGIRKVMGSSKSYLVFQFLTESVIVCLIAVIIGAFLAEWLLPSFNLLASKEISFSILERPWLLGILISAPLIIGVLAGLYPAFFITKFSPVKALKNRIRDNGSNGKVRNVLVVLQFAVSIVFISATIIVFNQLQHQRNLDLGFDRSNKIIIERTDRLGASADSFKERLKEMSLVASVTSSDAVPPNIYNFDNFSLKGSDQSEFPLNYITSDEHFVNSYGLKVLNGRGFQEGFNEKNRGLVNETLVKFLGFTENAEIIGRKLIYYEQEFEVIGVFNDFNTSYNANVRPFAIFAEGSDLFSMPGRFLSVSMNSDLSPDELKTLLSNLSTEWSAFNNRTPISYSFLDQAFEAQFGPTILFGKIMTTFSGLAIFIALLGMIGLITYTIEKKSKEIGVRKVLGASVGQILYLLSSRFGVLLLVAFIISIPMTWYFMDIWLQDFVSRREVHFSDFLLAGVMMVVITFAATGFQTIKAAVSNPVDALKDE